MSGIVGVGMYLLLGLVIVVAIISVSQSSLEERRSSQGHPTDLAPLTALAAIAEEAQRHSAPDLSALPWAPASPLAPLGESCPQAPPTLLELSKRVERLEAQLESIGGLPETSVNRSSKPAQLS